MTRATQNAAIVLILLCGGSAQAAITLQGSYAEGSIGGAPFSHQSESVAGAATALSTTSSGGFSSTAWAQTAATGELTQISAFFEQSRTGWIDNHSRGLVQIAFTPSVDTYFSLSGQISNPLGYTLMGSLIWDSLAPDDHFFNQYGAQGDGEFAPGNVNLWGYGSMHGTLLAGREYVWSVEVFTIAEFGFSATTKYQSSSMTLILEPLVTPTVASVVPEPASVAIWLLLVSAGVAPTLLRRLRGRQG